MRFFEKNVKWITVIFATDTQKKNVFEIKFK